MDRITHLLCGEELLLLREKAIIWPAKKALIIADLHLGKVTHFRNAGIPLPKEIEKDNFDRFSYLLLNNDIEVVYILGDLFHSDYNDQWARFIEFLSLFPDLQFHLIMGNHDILSVDNYQADNLKTYIELDCPPFSFTHKPSQHPKLYNMCGHIHPSIIMKGKGLQQLRLACFHFGAESAILPAFGAFTGTYNISPIEEDNVYVVTQEAIIKVV